MALFPSDTVPAPDAPSADSSVVLRAVAGTTMLRTRVVSYIVSNKRGGADLARLDKLIAKIKARPAEATFADVRRLLEAYGWELKRRESSHCTFHKPGESV